MHTIQQIAIKAESHEEAALTVKNIFDEMYSESEGLGGWSDWFVVGGGRWNSDPSNQYNDSYNDVISYEHNPEEFNTKLQETMTYRAEQMKQMKERIDFARFEELIDQFIENNGDVRNERYDMTSYYIRVAANMLSGYWGSDSYFYDIANFSTSPEFMQEDIDKGNKNWYLVPVDFHF